MLLQEHKEEKQTQIENKINYLGIVQIRILSGLKACKQLNGKIYTFDSAVHLHWSTASREILYGHKIMKSIPKPFCYLFSI